MTLAVALCGIFLLVAILMFWVTRALRGVQRLPWSGSTPVGKRESAQR